MGQCPTGGVGAEPTYSRISWTALALEAGKSPRGSATRKAAVPVAPPSAIIEFTSSSSPSWSPNSALLDTSANTVSRTRECAIDPL